MAIVLKRHNLSGRFPDFSTPEDFDALVQDIKENGQHDFITLHEGKILDGWNRYQACLKAGVEPKTTNYRGKNAEAFTWGKAFHRKHWSPSIRALLIVERTKWRPEGRPAETGREKPVSSAAEMAEVGGVGITLIKDAKKVEVNGSERLKEAVLNNEISITKAAAVTKLPKAKQIKAAKEKKPKAAPKPKKDAAPKAETVPKTKYDALVEKYNELQEEHKELAKELEGLDAIKNGDAAKELKSLQQQLKVCVRRRDELMTKVSDMQVQIKMWRTKYEKEAAKK